MIDQAIRYGRSIVGPKGEVRWAFNREHYEAAVEVIEERGGTERGYDASTILEKEGWVRVTDYRITTPNFLEVKKLTQAQRDVIFDMVMAAKDSGNEYSARLLMDSLQSIPE